MTIYSGEAARKLKVHYSTLFSLVRDGRVKPAPQKDSTGRYVWTPEDIARVKAVLDARRRFTPSNSGT